MTRNVIVSPTSSTTTACGVHARTLSRRRSIALVILFGTCTSGHSKLLLAQTLAQAVIPTEPGSPSPTLAQTVDFIAEAYKHQGPIVTNSNGAQYDYDYVVSKAEGCRLLVAMHLRITRTDGRGQHTHFLGRTISLDLKRTDPESLVIKPGSTEISIERTIWQLQSDNDAIDDNPPIPAPDGIKGTVKSVSADTVVFVAEDGHLMSLTGVKKVRRASDLMFDQFSSATFASLQTGDSILVKNREVAFFRGPQSDHQGNSFSMPQIVDQDSTTRVAKALIHAIVLCHEEQKPSLF